MRKRDDEVQQKNKQISVTKQHDYTERQGNTNSRFVTFWVPNVSRTSNGQCSTSPIDTTMYRKLVKLIPMDSSKMI